MLTRRDRSDDVSDAGPSGVAITPTATIAATATQGSHHPRRSGCDGSAAIDDHVRIDDIEFLLMSGAFCIRKR